MWHRPAWKVCLWNRRATWRSEKGEVNEVFLSCLQANVARFVLGLNSQTFPLFSFTPKNKKKDDTKPNSGPRRLWSWKFTEGTHGKTIQVQETKPVPGVNNYSPKLSEIFSLLQEVMLGVETVCPARAYCRGQVWGVERQQLQLQPRCRPEPLQLRGKAQAGASRASIPFGSGLGWAAGASPT